MTRDECLQLLSEKTAIERMLAEIPEQDVLDRLSLESRLKVVLSAIVESRQTERAPARVRLTFRGRPVVGTHGIFADFGMKAVNGYTESVAAMAASQTTQLAAMGPIPNRDQHQLLITSTALGSFGFELEEHQSGQLTLEETSPLAQAIERTQRLLRGAQGTDDELADSAADVDRRALEKVRTFLKTLVDEEAVCTVQLGDSKVTFSDVGQVRTCMARLSQENLREEYEDFEGEFQGVLPKARSFEFKVAESGHILRGKLGPAIVEPDLLNQMLHCRTTIKLMVTRVGTGRPRYVLVEPPVTVALG